MSKKILTMDQVQKYEKIYFGSKEKICGIYGIVFYRNDVNGVKIYIGNSIDIIARCKEHIRNLTDASGRKINKTSKKLMQCYKNKNYKMVFVVLERCNEDVVMSKEREYQHKWVKRNLLNNWVASNIDEIKPWLDKCIKTKCYTKRYEYSEKNFYNGTPCKESISIDTRGYAKIQVAINGKARHIRKHRAAYYEEYGEYPELVRHLCDNKKCYNPKHLVDGNYSENGLDKRGNFPERFEKDWVRLEGDVDKLTVLYGWKKNCRRKGRKVSTAVYEWEKKLGLREKYHDIYNNKRAMRPSLWKRKDIQEFIQKCGGIYRKKEVNVKTAEAMNKQFDLKLTASDVSNMKNKIGGKNKNRKRTKSNDKTGVVSVIKKYYENTTDTELTAICNKQLGTSYEVGSIRALRFDSSLYKPKMIQDKVGDLYRRDAVSRWGIEAEKLVEYFGEEYSDGELAKICNREYGEDMGFDEGVIQELRQLVGSGDTVGQT